MKRKPEQKNLFEKKHEDGYPILMYSYAPGGEPLAIVLCVSFDQETDLINQGWTREKRF